jgi:fluoride exporter
VSLPEQHSRLRPPPGDLTSASIDPDLDEAAPAGPPRPLQWPVIAAIAAGGVIGAEARYGVALALPHPGNAFPWSTVIINVSGCFALGVLMVVLLELTSPHRLARPFLGVGVLGGYTTYSTFAVDVQRMVVDDRPGLALSYVGVTIVACALAVWLATVATQALGRAVVARR